MKNTVWMKTASLGAPTLEKISLVETQEDLALCFLSRTQCVVLDSQGNAHVGFVNGIEAESGGMKDGILCHLNIDMHNTARNTTDKFYMRF
jgi:hypothetical protein